MTVTKILEQTLSAGATSVSFTDADIPNSLIRVFSSNSDLIPVSRILSGNTLTVTYEAQASAIDVAVEIVKAGLDIVDNLTSTDADKALSAKQGNLLNIAVEDVASDLSDLADTVAGLDIPDNITDLDDVEVSDIEVNQVLAWNGSKFVNVDQSGGGGGSINVDYSTANKLYSGSTTSWSTPLTYTATQNCIAYVRLKSDGSSGLTLTINGDTVYNTAVTGQNNTSQSAIFFLKTGDVLSKRILSDPTSIYVGYDIYPM